VGSEQTSSPSETTLHPVRVPVPEMLAARAVAAKPKKTPSITPEINRSMPCSMRTRINERFRPACLSCAKGELRRQYEQCADKDAGAKHERGNGIYPTEPHGTSLQWFANPSQCFERCGHRCGSGSGCIMVAAMQQPIATTSVIAIRETHISPLLSPALTIGTRIRTRKHAGWFRTGVRAFPRGVSSTR